MRSTRTTSFYRNFSIFAVSFVSIFSITSITNADAAGNKPILAPHRATYDLTLDTASGRSGIVAIKGRMVYEFTGAECEGYTVNLRIVTQFTDNDSKKSVTDVRTSSWEASDGSTFRFSSSHYLNSRRTQATQGSAKAGGSGEPGSFVLDKPAVKKSKMPLNTLFPTIHLSKMIEKALQGESIFEVPLFDGGDGGKVYETTTFIGREREPGTVKLTGKVDDKARKMIENMKSWPINISYFEGKAAGEETPAFEFAFDVFENGVASKVLINYSVFSMKGKLSFLELLDGPGC